MNTLVKVGIGGKSLNVEMVTLHSESAVNRWQNLLATAQPLLGNFSSGFGIWGSPGVALAGAAAIGLLEAAVTSANQKQGFQLIAEALALAERLKTRGRAVPVHAISGIERPDVASWRSRGEVESELDIRGKSDADKRRLIAEHTATNEEILSGFLVKNTMQDLVFMPSDFVSCWVEDKEILVRWSAIETYSAAM